MDGRISGYVDGKVDRWLDERLRSREEVIETVYS